jgi:hypothetical protein
MSPDNIKRLRGRPPKQRYNRILENDSLWSQQDSIEHSISPRHCKA